MPRKSLPATLVASPLERVLRAFAVVHPREGPTILLLLAGVFAILTAFYFIKPVREGWLAVSVVQGLSKLEVKAYSALAQSLLLVAIMPLYAWLTTRLTRRTLIVGMGLISAALMVLFWLVQPGLLVQQVPYAGVAFYLFVGIFGVTLLAQFWSFAADLYGDERGRRLFPLVAVGAAAGAMAGSWGGEQLIRLQHVDAFDLILAATIPVLVAVVFAAWADRRGARGQPSAATVARWSEPAVADNQGAFRQIAQHNYLIAAAAMALLFNWVVTSGDNILFALVQQALEDDLAGADVLPGTPEFSRLMKDATTAFYSDLYFWVNLIALFLQAFLVSRMQRLGGFRLLILVTPVVSLLAYLSMAVAPLVAVIKTMKVTENALNHSVNNTARQILWLPTSRAMVFQAKASIDTVFVRVGDACAAVTVLIGTRVFDVSLVVFLVFNAVLAGVWLLIALYIAAEHRRLSKQPVPPDFPQTSEPHP